jgi:hypothetical protein
VAAGRLGGSSASLHDEPTARALYPDVAVILAAVQIAATLALRGEGDESIEVLGHGAGSTIEKVPEGIA